MSCTLLRSKYASLFGLGQIAILCALLSVISVPLFGLGRNAILCTLLHVISVSLFVVYVIACNFCFFVWLGTERFKPF